MIADKVKAPAISLVVVAGIGIVLQLVSIVLNIVGIGAGSYDMMNQYGSTSQMTQYMASGVSGIIWSIFTIIYAGVIAWGGLQMMKLQSYGISMAAAIMAMIPCLSPCCVLGIPFGIWALVVLMDENVKMAFR